MTKKRKRTRNRRGMQVVTLCISTTMVLILLGLVVFFVLSARNLSAHMRENLAVTVMLKDSVSVNDAKLFCRDLYHRPYSHNIDYISKEQAQREQIKELGSDPTEFLGFNPFPATLEIQLAADYANRDSLKWIAKELRKDARVSDLTYMEDLMDKVNLNVPETGHRHWCAGRHPGHHRTGIGRLRTLSDPAWRHGHRNVGCDGADGCCRTGIRHCHYRTVCLAGRKQVPEDDGRGTL